MQTHAMHLHPEPFVKVALGEKRAELRLADEKRKSIAVGDYVVFTNRSSGEVIEVQVTEVREAESFQELLNYFGNLATTTSQELYGYYSSEQEKEAGVVGFRFLLKAEN